MNLNTSWLSPTPFPDCNFKLSYRRKGDSDYTVIDASGNTTSGSTSVTIAAPANFEGYVQGNCCDNILSAGDPFGVNAYTVLTVGIAVVNDGVSVDGYNFVATISSAYPNPYDTMVQGVISYTIDGVPDTYDFDATYPAGATSYTEILSSIGDAVITNISFTTFAPIFGNGGELQQYDGVRTPSYFRFTQTSGTTAYNGSPASLPSFTQDAFNITDRDIANNVLAGNLICSWAQGHLFNNGVSPNDIVTFEVYDPTPSLLGTTTIAAGPQGLRQVTIPLSKHLYAITDSVLLTMKVLTGADVIIDTHTFYLPPM